MGNSQKSLFNTSSRTKNTVKSSLIGVISNVFNVCLGFVYRTIFLNILSAEYLGINGLFTNILQVLSIAELGITTVIVYRFYKPIKEGNIQEVGKLMNFFKLIYRLIALIIFIAGLMVVPFVQLFINNTKEIPQDVNLQLVYILFLFNTVVSYLFVYKQVLLSADQRNYIVSIIQSIALAIKYTAQIIILILCKSYTLTLEIGIVSTLAINYILSFWITQKYKPIFKVSENISVEERRIILNDTKACMLHKIGATAKISTDNIILTKVISLVATGVYSNYSLIISSMQTIIGQLLGNFVSSIGNAHVSLNDEDNYNIYKKLLFIDLWISVVVTVNVYLLINDFIQLWIGGAFILDDFSVIILCLQFYICISRQINISYVNGCGLFVKDKIRPVVEAILNLVISIVLAKYVGIVGVFLGTVLSSILTVCWREPLVLFKYEFKKSVNEYWRNYLEFLFLGVIIGVVLKNLKQMIRFEVTWVSWIGEAFIYTIVINLVILLVFHNKDEIRFLGAIIKRKLTYR